MPWIGLRNGERVIPEGVGDDARVECPECSAEMHVRDGQVKARHFAHNPSDSNIPEGGCGGGGIGESDLHRKLKSLMVSRLAELYPDDALATCAPEVSLDVGDTDSDADLRRADVYLEFDTPQTGLGRGILAEVQVSHLDKDVATVEQDYREKDFSVLWVDAEDFDDGRCTLSRREIFDRLTTPWPANAPPVSDWQPVEDYWPGPDGDGEWVTDDGWPDDDADPSDPSTSVPATYPIGAWFGQDGLMVVERDGLFTREDGRQMEVRRVSEFRDLAAYQRGDGRVVSGLMHYLPSELVDDAKRADERNRGGGDSSRSGPTLGSPGDDGEWPVRGKKRSSFKRPDAGQGQLGDYAKQGERGPTSPYSDKQSVAGKRADLWNPNPLPEIVDLGLLDLRLDEALASDDVDDADYMAARQYRYGEGKYKDWLKVQPAPERECDHVWMLWGSEESKCVCMRCGLGAVRLHDEGFLYRSGEGPERDVHVYGGPSLAGEHEVCIHSWDKAAPFPNVRSAVTYGCDYCPAFRVDTDVNTSFSATYILYPLRMGVPKYDRCSHEKETVDTLMVACTKCGGAESFGEGVPERIAIATYDLQTRRERELEG